MVTVGADTEWQVGTLKLIQGTPLSVYTQIYHCTPKYLHIHMHTHTHTHLNICSLNAVEMLVCS